MEIMILGQIIGMVLLLHIPWTLITYHHQLCKAISKNFACHYLGCPIQSSFVDLFFSVFGWLLTLVLLHVWMIACVFDSWETPSHKFVNFVITWTFDGIGTVKPNHQEILCKHINLNPRGGLLISLPLHLSKTNIWMHWCTFIPFKTAGTVSCRRL